MQAVSEMKRGFVAFMKDETGASTIEYIVGAAVMALLAAGVYTKLKDKINTAIPTPLPRIVLPQPDLVDLSCPFGIVRQKPFYEMLKLPPPLSGVRVKGREKVSE